MATNKNRIVLTGIGIVVIVAALLFGGAGITAYASQSSLPGDTLYGVKTTLEQTRLTMARDASMRADLYMEFAETRLQEIGKLISEQRYQNIASAAADFETYANKAIAELEVVAQGNPEQAAVLTARISETLSRYARTLTSMLDSVPEPVKAQLQQVIESSSQSQSSPAVQQTEVEFSGTVETIVEGAWIIAGRTVFIHTQTEIKGDIQVGDFVKVHAALNSDGDLVAREIELDAADDDSNTNSNDNANSNDDNSNDDNANSNSNDNDDDDDNANSNSNSNDNDDDDNMNSNDDNSNDDDHNSNSNDDNSNDQSDDNGNDDYKDDDNGNDDKNDDNGNDEKDDSNDNGDDD